MSSWLHADISPPAGQTAKPRNDGGNPLDASTPVKQAITAADPDRKLNPSFSMSVCMHRIRPGSAVVEVYYAVLAMWDVDSELQGLQLGDN